MSQLWANNASTTLPGNILSTDVSFVVASVAGFPIISLAGDYFYATLTNASDTETAWEIVKVTATSGTTFTATRGVDGTTALGWPASSKVEICPTAQGLRDLASTIQFDGGSPLNAPGSAVLDGGTL